MKFLRVWILLAIVGVLLVDMTVPALAGPRPAVTGLSVHRGTYWGGIQVTVTGRNFIGVSAVTFGHSQAWSVQVVSPTKLTVTEPEHGYGTVHVKVVTAMGTSSISPANGFTFTRPTLDSPIMGGLTARQEQRISSQVRAHHHGTHRAPGHRRWTAAMGLTAMRRARSWLGLPYSWAGGNGSGPTIGVCAHNGGDMDCHVVGFDCSGLALYAWSPYKHLVHYASTQHSSAGRFHPSIGQLMPGDLVFFSGYIADGIGHVAVYEGHGMVIEAAESGTQVKRSRLVDVIADSGVYRGATRPTSTGRQGSGPHVSSVTSQVAAHGGTIALTGSRLGGVTSVAIGGTRVYSFVRRTAKRLVLRMPARRAGRAVVSVSNAWGTVQRSISVVAAPHVSSLAVTHGPVAGGNSVAALGQHLDTVNRVTVDGQPVPFTLTSAYRVVLTMPAHRAGAVWVVLHSRFGTADRRRYTYVSPVSSPPASPSASPTATSRSTPGTGHVSPSASSTSPPGTSPAGATSSGPGTSAAPSSSPSPSSPSSSTTTPGSSPGSSTTTPTLGVTTGSASLSTSATG